MNPSGGLISLPKHPPYKPKEAAPTLAADGGSISREGLSMGVPCEANTKLPNPPVVSGVVLRREVQRDGVSGCGREETWGEGVEDNEVGWLEEKRNGGGVKRNLSKIKGN
ncbi:hypothetical protein L1987_41047 [Smallanthus sonchifolius]|uniref:Uncharacterized protein n=1 Tax=Smallanthus sonchifolius TaxID=185202 RepID=A0ACB9GV36_9ASTR|nr:hypothetical protein L1987_41047 [Smallanthus sonchifolius]